MSFSLPHSSETSESPTALHHHQLRFCLLALHLHHELCHPVMSCGARATRAQGATAIETTPIRILMVLRQVQVATHSLTKTARLKVLAASVPASATRSIPARYLLKHRQSTPIALSLREKRMTATAESGQCQVSVLFHHSYSRSRLSSSDRDKDVNDIPLGAPGSSGPMQPPKRPRINRHRYTAPPGEQHALAKKLLPIDPSAGDKTRGRKD
jgi:hypothetical protein